MFKQVIYLHYFWSGRERVNPHIYQDLYYLTYKLLSSSHSLLLIHYILNFIYYINPAHTTTSPARPAVGVGTLCDAACGLRWL